jgi:hypothetical protein
MDRPPTGRRTVAIDPEGLGMLRPLDRSRPSALGLLAIVLILASSRGGASDTGGPIASMEPWPTGRSVAIEVKGGKASFDIPTPSPGARTLVIVSALAKQGGPFPIRLIARSADKSKSIGRAVGAAVRSPKRDLPNLGPVPDPVVGLPPARRTFHLLVQGGDVSRASSYLAVEGRLTAVGRRIQVYVDANDLGAVGAETLRDLVATFDESVFPSAATRFGPAEDVDRDGRFTVLFSSWLTRLAGGKTSVDGFVRGADLDLGLGFPFGNRCDMMYLSTALQAGPHLRTILAHEYTHAVNFSRKALASRPAGLEEEGWLDEAIAHLVEDAHGFSKSNIDYRVSAFLSRPERYRLVVDDYYAADLFRSHGNRGATYLFLRWCVDRYGPGLLDSLVRSGDRGVANLEAATGSTFADLFRRWTVALAMSGLDPASEPEEAYRSIDPRGELEDWILAGPRMTGVTPGGWEDSWSAEATTAHYALVEGSSRGAVAVEVIGPPGAELQVTAVRLPSGSGRPDLTVRALPASGGEIQVKAEVVERDGNPVRLGALAWEPLVPLDEPRTLPGSRGGLDMLGIASSFGTSALPAGGSLTSRAIRLPRVKPGDGPLVFKAVGTDAKGRRVAAWTEVSPPSRSVGSIPENSPIP